MKQAAVTVRLPLATRLRIEELARREGRSLSAQIERLVEKGMESGPAVFARGGSRGLRSLSGVLSGGRIPTLRDFRAARAALSRALDQRSRRDVRPRR